MNLQKLLKYLIGTTIFAFFYTPSAAGFPKIFDLYSKDIESVVVTSAGFPLLFIFCSSLLNCHEIPDVSE